tara:strand:- start:3011 stop:3484 length:474 start_codon:yes stop_codon:yes gene_type:complete
MKVNTLVEIIRKVIKEEVTKVVRKELRASTISNKKDAMGLKELMYGEEKRPKKRVNERHYTKNEALNKILNETVGGVPQSEEAYPTMMNKAFTTKDTAELGYKDLLNDDSEEKLNQSAQQTFQDVGAQIHPENAVAKAMTRNYGDLMKAIDKKRGKK